MKSTGTNARGEPQPSAARYSHTGRRCCPAFDRRNVKSDSPLGGISRASHGRLRALLVTGATAVIRCAARPGNKLATDRLLNLLRRKPRKLAAMALANKMARMAWAIMTSSEPYRRPATAGLCVAAVS